MSHIGIEIGGTKLQLGVAGAAGTPLSNRFRYAVDPAQGAAGILWQLEQTLNGLSSVPAGIGVGFGGPVDRRTGRVAASHQIGGWSGFALEEWFTERYACPVAVENDANAAALAEARYGAGKAFERVFYVTLGSGVGGGMVVNGALYHGQAPGEAEIGLINLDGKGNTLESFCSGWALDGQIRQAVAGLPAGSVLKKAVGHTTGGEARCLPPALAQADPVSGRIMDTYTDYLCWGLSHVVHLFNPEAIVLGGGVSLLGEPLRERVAGKLPGCLITAYRPGPQVLLSGLGEWVVPLGALALVRNS